MDLWVVEKIMATRLAIMFVMLFDPLVLSIQVEKDKSVIILCIPPAASIAPTALFGNVKLT